MKNSPGRTNHYYLSLCVMLAILGFAVLAGLCAKIGIITTVAGSDDYGYGGDNGPATRAKLNFPDGVAVDASGNLYFADLANHRVRKVNPSGIITTVAGNGAPGYSGDSGAATSASLNDPRGVAIDAGGNLYIADSNHIRKVNTSGIITTVAGNGAGGVGGDNGAAINAAIHPRSIAIDGNGNIYFGDFHRIRKVDSNGIITTVAGNGMPGYNGDGGPATSASLKDPWGVAVDVIGNLYIADTQNNRVRKVDATGIITTIAGNGTGVLASNQSGNVITYTSNDTPEKRGDNSAAVGAALYYPVGVSVDVGGNLYVADNSDGRIRKINTDGIVSTVAGGGSWNDTWGYNGDHSLATNAFLNQPRSIAIDHNGDVYIADSYSHRIRRVSHRFPWVLLGVLSFITLVGASLYRWRRG